MRTSSLSSALARTPRGVEGDYFYTFLDAYEATRKAEHPDSARFGRRRPRIATPPLRELAPDTSLGYDLIDFASSVLKVDLLPWQAEVAIRALELREDGRYRFRTIVAMAARQQGKSLLSVALGLWALYGRELPLVMGTAQDLATAEDILKRGIMIARGNEVLRQYISDESKVNGQKSLEVFGRCRWIVKATNDEAGRGMSVDLLMLDELLTHKSWDAWGALTATTIARPDSQVWCMSNAGSLESIVLNTLRKRAHAMIGDPDGLNGDEPDDSGDDTLGFFEYSASPERGLRDREGWFEANPSAGYLFDEDTIASRISTSSDDKARQEILCQWVVHEDVGPFANGAWEMCADPVGVIPDDAPITYAVDVSWDRDAAYVAACGPRADGRMQVEVVAARPGRGWIDWVPEWFRGFVDEANPARVVLQMKYSPTTSLANALSDVDGLTVVPWMGTDVGEGCGLFYDHVMAGDPESSTSIPKLAHRSQEALNIAAHSAKRRTYGAGWYWDRQGSSQDISPLVAATEALWDQLVHAPVAPSIYEAGPLALA